MKTLHYAFFAGMLFGCSDAIYVPPVNEQCENCFDDANTQPGFDAGIERIVDASGRTDNGPDVSEDDPTADENDSYHDTGTTSLPTPQPPPTITGEEEGLEVITDELSEMGYSCERNDGSWQITLQNPETGEYNLVLQPDLRCWEEENGHYSYFEFDSGEDPGVGYSSDFPLYREIGMDTEEKIKEIVRSHLHD